MGVKKKKKKEKILYVFRNTKWLKVYYTILECQCLKYKERNLKKVGIHIRKEFSFKTFAMKEVCQDNTALMVIVFNIS